MVAVIQREMMQSLIAEVGTNSKPVLEVFEQNLTDGYCKWHRKFHMRKRTPTTRLCMRGGAGSSDR